MEQNTVAYLQEEAVSDYGMNGAYLPGKRHEGHMLGLHASWWKEHGCKPKSGPTWTVPRG